MMDRLNTPLKLRQQRLGHDDAEMTLGVTVTWRRKMTFGWRLSWEKFWTRLDLSRKRKGLL
jgi:hypothetical protein